MSERKNKVVTYIVALGMNEHSYVDAEVEKALEDGYRVIDVISTPSGSAGQAANSLVAITVVMDKTADARYNWKS